MLNDQKYMTDHIEAISGDATRNLEDVLIDTLNAEVEETIDFEAEGYQQVQTKGGLRWVKKTT